MGAEGRGELVGYFHTRFQLEIAIAPPAGLVIDVDLDTDRDIPIGLQGERLAIAGQSNNRVRVIDIADGRVTEIVTDLWRVQYVAWHPEGRYLVVTGQPLNIGSTDGELLLIDLSSEDQVLLHRGRTTWFGQPYFSNDGELLAFLRFAQNADLWLLVDETANEPSD